MAEEDTQQQQLLERLRAAGSEPVPFSELHASGIDFPAAVVSELELCGYVIDRVYHHGHLAGVRLLEPEDEESSASYPRRRWRWPRRTSAD